MHRVMGSHCVSGSKPLVDRYAEKVSRVIAAEDMWGGETFNFVRGCSPRAHFFQGSSGSPVLRAHDLSTLAVSIGTVMSNTGAILDGRRNSHHVTALDLRERAVLTVHPLGPVGPRP